MTDQKVATNRQAPFKYHLLEKFEAGVALLGPEVKSIREGHVNLKESFIRLEKGEAFLYHMHIRPYPYAGAWQDPTRTRKLLLKKSEIARLASRIAKKGFTCIPLSVYFNKRGKVKLEIAVGQGKKLFDKREALKKRADEREMGRAMKRRRMRGT